MKRKYFNYTAKIFHYFKTNNEYTESVIKNIVDSEYSNIIKIIPKSVDYNLNILDQIFAKSNITRNDICNFFTYLFWFDNQLKKFDKLESFDDLKTSLNDELIDKVHIIYTYESIDRHSNGFDNLISYFKRFVVLYIDKRKIIVNNSYVGEEYSSLKIGIARYPFGDNKKVNIDESGKKIYINSNSKFTDCDNEFLRKCQILKEDKNCNIIFGPEYCGSSILDEKLKNLCDENTFLLFNPSYYKEVDGKKENSSEIRVYVGGHRYKTKVIKGFPATMYDKKLDCNLVENIDQGVSQISIVHVKGFGRIGLFICKDFLQNDINSLVNELNIDVIILQLYSRSVDDFITKIDYFASEKRVLMYNNYYIKENIENDDIYVSYYSKNKYKCGNVERFISNSKDNIKDICVILKKQDGKINVDID